MTLSQLLLIFRARIKIILLVLAVTLVAALAVSLLMPRQYKASTAVVLNSSGTDPVTGLTVPSQLLSGYMPTQLDIIHSMSVALKVVDHLNMAEDRKNQERFQKAMQGEGDIRDWLASGLLSRLEVSTSRESSVITITYKSPDPQQAALIANAFATAYQQISIQLKVDPSRQTSQYFNQQIKGLRENFENAQRRLSKYQQENGIVSSDKSMDVESMRLNELSSQLVLAQGQLMEATSRRGQAQGRMASESPDVANNPLIQTLKSDLGRAEARLAEISQRLAHNHPQYQAAQAEVNKLRTDLNQQTRSIANTISNNAAILQQREAELRAAVAAQKDKVLTLNRARDELSVLTKEMDTAQRAYENISQRYTQSNLEGQANLSDIAVLTTALPPRKPSSPNITMNLALALVVGLLLGLGAALLLELTDHRVRSAEVLVTSLGLPVLGIIRKTATLSAPAPMQLEARTTNFLPWSDMKTPGWTQQFTRQQE